MKVLVYSLNYFPEQTATGKYTGEMSEWLARRGHDMEAIAGLPHYPQWKTFNGYKNITSPYEILNGVRVSRSKHFVPDPEKVTALNRIRMEINFSINASKFWAKKISNRNIPDVTIALMPPMQLGMFPYLFSVLKGIPWILHVQDLQVEMAFNLGMLNGGPISSVLYGIENYFLRRATYVSTITDAMRRRIVEKGIPESKIWKFPNWADIDGVKPGNRKNGVRKKLGLSNNDVVVLYAGGMGNKQGLELVIEAAGNVQKNKNVKFLMVGDGAARIRLERQAKEERLNNITFLPVQPQEKFNQMLATGDIHLIVQRENAADLVMPSKLTNILAAGRACVATANPGTALHDVVEGHNTGLTCKPGDAEALVEGIERLAGNENLRNELGRNGRRYAEMNLDKEKILLDFEKKLISLVKASKRG